MVKKAEEKTDSVSVKIARGGDYGSWKYEVQATKIVSSDEMMEAIDELTEQLQEKMDGYVESLGGNPVEKEEVYYARAEDVVPDGFNNVEQTPDTDEGVTEEQIREMDRKELVALIKELELDVNPKEYKKVGDLIEAVLELLKSDDGAESTDTADDGISEEQIREMNRRELMILISEYSLDVDPKEYKKIGDLIEAVLSAMGAAEGDVPSEDEIREMDMDELKELIDTQSLDINVRKYKKAADLAEKVIEELSKPADDSFDNDFDNQ